jgi:hypothetical protein
MEDILLVIILTFVVISFVLIVLLVFYLNKFRKLFFDLLKKFNIKDYLQGNPQTKNLNNSFVNTDASAMWVA